MSIGSGRSGMVLAQVLAGMVLIALLAPGGALGADRGTHSKPLLAAIGPEIRRGADAAFGCQLSNSAHPLDGGAYLQCLEGRQRINRQQMGPAADAFDAGLWYAARGRFRALTSVAPGAGSNANLDLAIARLREAEQASGVIDDAGVWRAVHPGAGDPSLSDRAPSGARRHPRGL